MRWGGCNGRSTAVAATASGGVPTAPGEIADAHGNVGTTARANHRKGNGGKSDGDDDQAGDRDPVLGQPIEAAGEDAAPAGQPRPLVCSVRRAWLCQFL